MNEQVTHNHQGWLNGWVGEGHGDTEHHGMMQGHGPPSRDGHADVEAGGQHVGVGDSVAVLPAWTADTVEAGVADANVGDGQGGGTGYLLELRPGLDRGRK